MRIRVSKTVAIPTIFRSSDGEVVLNINTGFSFEDIEGFVGNQFMPGEREIAYSLWSDDESERTFTPIEGTSDFYIDLK